MDVGAAAGNGSSRRDSGVKVQNIELKPTDTNSDTSNI
jgi:hypothetical protein